MICICLEKSFEIDYVIKGDNKFKNANKKDLEALNIENIDFYLFSYLDSKKGKIGLKNFINSSKACKNIKDYNFTFVFGDQNIVDLVNLNNFKIAWPDDPPHLVALIKSRSNLLRISSRMRSFLSYLRLFIFKQKLTKNLKKYSRIIHHSKLHALQFKKWTHKDVIYSPPIIPIFNRNNIMKNKSSSIDSTPERFIHIGHLGGAASLSSINTLLDSNIIDLIDKFSLKFDLVGKIDIPLEIKNKLIKANYLLKGFVDDIDKEIINSKFLVIAGNYGVGSRTRILHSLALGTPVIAHQSSTRGIPDLHKCKAIFLYDSINDFEIKLKRAHFLDKGSYLDLRNRAKEFIEFNKEFWINKWINTISKN